MHEGSTQCAPAAPSEKRCKTDNDGSIGGRMTEYLTLREWLGDHSKRKRLTIDALSAQLGFSRNTVAAWRAGRRTPDKTARVALAKCFAATAAEEAELLAELEGLVLQSQDSRRSSLAQLYDGVRALRVLSVDAQSPKLKDSQKDPAFLPDLLKRFERVAGIRVQHVPETAVRDFTKALVNRKIDVAHGVFATIDRALLLYFFLTPFRFGLNAIYLASAASSGAVLDGMRRSLTPGATTVGVRPIVVEHDIGHTYVTRMLPYESDTISLMNRVELRELVRLLTVTSLTRRLPVFVSDEVTCLKIVSALRRSVPEGTAPWLVFSLTDEDSVQVEKRPLPEFMISMALERTHSDLREYLADALALFLQTETETTSDSYLETYLRLETMARDYYRLNGSSEKVSDEKARKWAKYSSRIDSLSGFQSSLPWERITERVREKRDSLVTLERHKRAASSSVGRRRVPSQGAK